MIVSAVASCSVIGEGLVSTVNGSTYPVKDDDIFAAEDAYLQLELDLKRSLIYYEETHTYDEYHYSTGSIGHDPYALISAITALKGGEWNSGDIAGELKALFESQYVLTESVVRETRYRTEERTMYFLVYDDNTGSYSRVPYTFTERVAYSYYICTVTLESKDLGSAAQQLMTDDQKALYDMYMLTKGNRPDLFPEEQEQ
jgi:hypothetical protein